jgi:toxin ParE1/3/4
MHVEFSEDAEADLDGVHEYLCERDPAAATRVVDAILSAAVLLQSFPLIGKEGRIIGTRELVVPGWTYVLVYSIKDPFQVQVERVLHAKRLWPPEEIS